MATFDELVESARNPGEGFVLDAAFIEALADAHTADLGGVAGQAEILTADLLREQDALQAAQAEISALKATNHDLLTRSPADSGGGEGDDGGDDDADDSPDIDDLFD